MNRALIAPYCHAGISNLEICMKSIYSLALILALSSTPLLATAGAPDPHEGHHPAAGTTKKAPAKAAKPSAKMDAQMKSMQEMHEKMMQAKTPEERAALMKDNMKNMQNGMAMMNGMEDKGCGKGMMESHQEQMDMMKMMMQSMMDQMSQPVSDAAK